MASQTTSPNCGGKDDDAGSDGGQNDPCGYCDKKSDVLPAQSCEAGTSRCCILKTLNVLAIIVVLGIVVAILLPFVNLGAGEAARRAQCGCNLHNLTLAMLNYHEKYGCFPPAFVADKNGKPMHSWRVLLLPYLDRNDLYSQYRFDEPWDSPNNRKVTDVALRDYRCYCQPDTKQPTTSYMMVIGPHTISDGPHSRKASGITDGPSNTIMLVEVADSDVGWAEPKDLSFDQLDFKINGSKRPGIGSHHSGGANVVFCDGHGRFIYATTPPELIKAMLTIDGGEKIPEEEY